MKKINKKIEFKHYKQLIINNVNLIKKNEEQKVNILDLLKKIEKLI